MGSPRNLYAILNVAPDAESVVIEAAYRALMKKYHPDQGHAPALNGSSAAEINLAFAVLRDAEKRADYDHREWKRTQAIQLVQFQAALPVPPRRHTNVFGWGGWLVALVLAGALGLIASQSGSAPPMTRIEAARTAALAEPDLRSQPAPPAVSPTELAQIRADAYAGRDESADRNVAAAESAAAAAQNAAAAAAEAESAPPPAPHAAPRRKPHARAAGPEKDFVERHGGIY